MTNKDRAYAVRTLLSVLGSAHCSSLTQLAESDRRTVMAIFRELAGGEPFCIDTLREVSMEALRRYLKKVLLEVRVLLLCSFN